MISLKKIFIVWMFGLFLLICLQAKHAFAQVPPHNPGEICFTAYFWCWAEYPGPPGAYCECWYNGDWYPGYLG